MRKSSALPCILLLGLPGCGIHKTSPPATPSLSATSYTFPQDAVGNAITATVATLTNPTAAAITLSTDISGDASMTLNSAQSCGAQLAAGTSCPIVVQYLPTAAGAPTAAVTVAYSGSASGSASVALAGTATATAAGGSTVSPTSNPLVALFTVTPGFAASVTVQFGLDTAYGYTTSAFATSAANSAGPVSIEVGGMRADTTYHMRAQIAYASGKTVTTADLTFITGSLPADLAALRPTVTTAPGMTPQPGIELIDPVLGGAYQPYATDLQGNIIWYYPWADYGGTHYLIDGIKQLGNGDFVAVLGVDNNLPLPQAPDPAKVVVREFDLIGNTVKQLTLPELNSKLAAAGYKSADGSPLVLDDFHHDVTPLPNGHWLLLTNTIETVNIQGKPTPTQGDVVVDLDAHLNPVYVWSEFDHLDPVRQPMGFPDWTHSNAILYTPEDGNFLVSIRHQNWIVKVNYQDGAGDGSVLWRLGYQGDFTLENADGSPDTDPADWQYAQHGPSLAGSASAGVFDLALMDNGNDRIIPGNLDRCPLGKSQFCYTTVPVFQVDEDARTVKVESRVTLPTSPTDLYSYFGGNAEVLANSDLEYDLGAPTSGAQIIESLPDSNHTLVWSFHANGDFDYRGFRLPSLYQGVQWP